MDSFPQTIGPYDIQREIGRGGMGIVYLAREREGGRRVALKVLRKECTSDPGRVRRFQREARVVARVRHPNVVPLYGVGEENGFHWIAMRYVPGTSLDVLIRRQDGPRIMVDQDTAAIDRALAELDARPRAGPAEQRTKGILTGPQWLYCALRVVEKIARALAHLHDHGIVHRDVKPANILIDQRGEPWLADFGLVRDSKAETVSEEDGLLGTVQYIAPEQIDGTSKQPDPRSDLYSLGVTLYELVTLKRPFEGRGTSSTLYAVAREAPTRPTELNPGVSDDLERVIEKAMSKDPEVRYQTGRAFADDLRRVRTFKPLVMPRPSLTGRLKRFCVRSPVLAGAILFGLLSFVGMLEYGIYREITESRRLVECRAEADQAFESGRFNEAAVGYRLYLKMGGSDTQVLNRLEVCEDKRRSGRFSSPPR